MNRFMFSVSALIFASLIGLPPSASYAQHVHQHNGHFDIHQNVQHGHDQAGHLTDRWGHHIDGDGHHTGSIGVYENGSFSRPQSNFYPHYPSYPTYVAPAVVEPQYYPSVISSPSSIVFSPSQPATMGSTRVASNKVPVASQTNSVPGSGLSGGSITLSNPSDSGGSIRYTLNQYPYSINPGESQTIKVNREWNIKFDNGLNRELVYRLEDGRYKFTVSPQKGWDLAKVEAELPSPPVMMDRPQASQASNSIPGK